MNEIKREKTVNYFADRIVQCRKNAQELALDDRADEAVFAKVQLNIYDIFNTVFSVAAQTSGQDDQKLVQFFLLRIHQIPQSWHIAQASAAQHGETEKAHIERIKLEAVAEIKREFAKIWEVEA